MFDVELVGKIGSVALIDRAHNDVDYNKFARIGRFLRPGVVWISSGAAEIGRLDYVKRSGGELEGDADEIKTDYASQGQIVLMNKYREFIDAKYSVRQLLVEHQHFNDAEKRRHLRDFLLRAVRQNAVPIINYNDAVSDEETRKLEIQSLKRGGLSAVELIDNDETASQIACLLNARLLVILTGVNGIYRVPSDPSTLIKSISGRNAADVLKNIDECKKLCDGASRAGANGAAAKLEYIKPCVTRGARVIIANAAFDISDIIAGNVPRTVIGV